MLIRQLAFTIGLPMGGLITPRAPLPSRPLKLLPIPLNLVTKHWSAVVNFDNAELAFLAKQIIKNIIN